MLATKRVEDGTNGHEYGHGAVDADWNHIGEPGRLLKEDDPLPSDDIPGRRLLVRPCEDGSLNDPNCP